MSFALWFAVLAFAFFLASLILSNLKRLIIVSFLAFIAASVLTYMLEKNPAFLDQVSLIEQEQEKTAWPWENRFWCSTVPIIECK